MPPRKTEPKAPSKEANWAIKKPDAEPLTRSDIQYSLLSHLFSDRTFRFTAPVDQSSAAAPPLLLNFDQLYLEAILSSLKTTTALRQKLVDNPTFAADFCKVALLVNCGRINTTLAFYPSMKTALRTYHPIPSLQKNETSQRDLQDAPRIKGILKACMLDWEVADPPINLRDIARKAASSEALRGPPTTIVTAIFHLFSETSWVSQKYFPAGQSVLDIFYPSDLPALPRANLFLALLHRILETPTQFLADFDTVTPPPIMLPPASPTLRPISLLPVAGDAHLAEGVSGEFSDIDTVEELAYAAEMKALRGGIVKTVPGIIKREKDLEDIKGRREEHDLMKDLAAEPAKKRARESGASSLRSFARVSRDIDRVNKAPNILPIGWESDAWMHTVPVGSSLPLTWATIKQDLTSGRDPDYDSDEDSPWGYDLLLRRSIVTVPHPTTGVRGPPQSLKNDFDEWKRRQEAGPEQDDDIVYHGDDMEREKESDGEDD